MLLPMCLQGHTSCESTHPVQKGKTDLFTEKSQDEQRDLQITEGLWGQWDTHILKQTLVRNQNSGLTLSNKLSHRALLQQLYMCMGHRTWDKPDRASLMWKLSSSELESPSGEKWERFKECQKGKKSASHPIITRKESRDRGRRERRDETGQGRIPETAGAYKMGAHALSRVPNFSVWLFTSREAGSLTGWGVFCQLHLKWRSLLV